MAEGREDEYRLRVGGYLVRRKKGPMRAAIAQRLDLARQMAERPWFRAILLIWGAIGIWDTALSQLVPETLAKDAPKAYQIAIWLLNMTGGWLPFWGWLLIGAILLVIGTLEFSFRSMREERLMQRYAQHSTSIEKGFLDFQADAEQAMADLTKVIDVSADDTSRFAKALFAYGRKVQRIVNPQRRRKFASEVARYIDAYSERMQRAANFISSVTPVVSESQLGLIKSESNMDALQLFADSACHMAETISASTVTSLEGMRESTNDIKGISADLNVAGTNLEGILGDFIEKTKEFAKVCQQGQMAALERIRQLKNQ